MKKHIALSTAIVSLFFATTNAQAAKPLELQKVMKDLGTNMQIVTDGISSENWPLVERTSRLIGEHPQPPFTEKMRIMSFMGTSMSKFKAFDEQTHEAAKEMATAAQAKDGQKVISSFQKLQSSCLACHQAFRPAFVEHFHEKPSH